MKKIKSLTNKENRYYSAMQNLYNILKNENNLIITNFSKENSIDYRFLLLLKSKNIIDNLGSNKKPEWVWQHIEAPNIPLLKEMLKQFEAFKGKREMKYPKTITLKFFFNLIKLTFKINY